MKPTRTHGQKKTRVKSVLMGVGAAKAVSESEDSEFEKRPITDEPRDHAMSTKSTKVPASIMRALRAKGIKVAAERVHL